MLKGECWSEIHGQEHKDKVNSYFLESDQLCVFWFLMFEWILDKRWAFCGHLVVDKAPVLLCLASELPGEVELSLEIWVAGLFQLKFVLLAWALSMAAATLAKPQGCRMSGHVYLDCVKPLEFYSASGFPVVWSCAVSHSVLQTFAKPLLSAQNRVNFKRSIGTLKGWW